MAPNSKSRRLPWEEILVRNRTKYRTPSYLLRRAMLEAGIPSECERCQLTPTWCERPLVLQIDHVDGDFNNNEADNLRFLCPNCHSQTVNFGAKNRNKLGEGGIDELYAWTGEDYEL